MKYNVTQLEGKNEPVNSVLGTISLNWNKEITKLKKPAVYLIYNPMSFDFYGLMRLTIT